MLAPDHDEELAEDTLFLACTRPAMFLGVPVEALSLNIMLTGIVFLAGGSPLYLLTGGVVHLVFRAIVRTDHNAFRVLFVWLETKARCRNSAWWGGSSVSPLRVTRSTRKGGGRV
jgi:type IV secretion system protein VirB3